MIYIPTLFLLMFFRNLLADLCILAGFHVQLLLEYIYVLVKHGGLCKYIDANNSWNSGLNAWWICSPKHISQHITTPSYVIFSRIKPCEPYYVDYH